MTYWLDYGKIPTYQCNLCLAGFSHNVVVVIVATVVVVKVPESLLWQHRVRRGLSAHEISHLNCKLSSNCPSVSRARLKTNTVQM